MSSTNGHGPKSGASGRVALYLRVSSDEQRERQTIETQREFLEQYCGLYELEAAGTYADDGVPGTSPLHERPEGRRLLKDAQAGKFDTLLVYRLDRLGRVLLVIVDAHDRLQTAGVSLRSATEPIDTSTPSGRLIFQMLASFAEYERETIRERTRDGMQRAYKNGKQTGRIPYGYDIDRQGAFVVVEQEARVVREIFANVADGSTLYQEAKRLNSEGEPSPGYRYRNKPRVYGTSWYPSTIRAILRNTAFVGTHVVNTRGGPVERKVPAVVEPELRHKAVERLEENKRYSGGKEGRKYLLRGLVRCARCITTYVGDPSVSSMGYRYYYYACAKKKKIAQDKRRVPAQEKLTCPSIKAQWLEDLVWQDVRSFLEHPGEVLERVRKQLREEGEDSDDLQARHASLMGRLAAKHDEKGRYIKLYAKGNIDEEELELYLSDLRNQIENLKLLITSVEADMATKQENKMVAASTEAWLLTLRNNLREVEEDTVDAFDKRRELVKLLVQKITISRNEDGQAKADITYRFGPPVDGPEAMEEENISDGVRNLVVSQSP